MIRGVVTIQATAVVPLRLRGPTSEVTTTDALVDTGFNDTLILPKSTVTLLKLDYDRNADLMLADASVSLREKYTVEVEWNGTWRTTLAWSFGNESIMGMLLLADHRLAIDVKLGGAVEIIPLP